MTETTRVLEELAECCRLAYGQRLVGGTGGNMSVRIGDDVYITATGCRLGDVQADTLVRVSLDGRVQGNVKPSKELDLHLGIYRSRSDVGAVAHLHPVHSIVVSILAQEGAEVPMPGYSAGYLNKIGRCGLVGALEPGSDALAQALVRAMEKTDVVLMRNHGITTVGATIKTAFSLLEEAESNAELHLRLQGKGAMEIELG